jgi:hypothetical protein
MFLRRTRRKKDGKTHSCWSVVETQRVHAGRVVQRHVLYLGEINASQAAVWRKAIEVLDDAAGRPQTLALFPEDDCTAVAPDASIVPLRLSEMRLCRPLSGARAGWPGSCGESCNWIGSGQHTCRGAAKARVGIRFCRYWPAIG